VPVVLLNWVEPGTAMPPTSVARRTVVAEGTKETERVLEAVFGMAAEF
jgi:hypothetical protein